MRLIIILSIFLFAMSAGASDVYRGDEINNGGGLAEKNFAFAYRTLTKYTGPCLKAESCKLTATEKQLLFEIHNSIHVEQKYSNQLKFSTPKETPQLVIRGSARVAVTGDTIGSDIIINTDLINPPNEAGQPTPMSISDAIAVLVHEFGHHHRGRDFSHSTLDLLGSKVALFAQKLMITTPLLPNNNDVAVTIINEKSMQSFPTVLIQIYGDIVNVTHEFKKELDCRSVNLPIPINIDAYIPGSKPSAAMYHNLFWKNVEQNNEYRTFVVRGDLTAMCKTHDSKIKPDTDYKVDILFRVKKEQKDGKEVWKYHADSLDVDQTRGDAWWKIINIPLIDHVSASPIDHEDKNR